MHKDKNGNVINEGDMVEILHVEPNWFNYLSNDSCEILLKACNSPVEVCFLDEDDRVCLSLPATKQSDGCSGLMEPDT